MARPVEPTEEEADLAQRAAEAQQAEDEAAAGEQNAADDSERGPAEPEDQRQPFGMH